MSLYILDTDHASLLQRGNSHIAARIKSLSYQEIAVTTITAEEQFRGRLKVIRRASSGDRLVRAYAGLRTTIEFFKNIRLLDFDDVAADRYAGFRKQKIRTGTQDLRIAAVAISIRAILVTRNRYDFTQIPGLAIEDWS